MSQEMISTVIPPQDNDQVADDQKLEQTKPEPIVTDRDFYRAEPNKFYKNLGRKAGKVLKYSLLLRFALNLLVHRFNFIKAIKNSMPVFRLGVACTTFNLVYHLIRRLFAKLRRSSKKR